MTYELHCLECSSKGSKTEWKMLTANTSVISLRCRVMLAEGGAFSGMRVNDSVSGAYDQHLSDWSSAASFSSALAVITVVRAQKQSASTGWVPYKRRGHLRQRFIIGTRPLGTEPRQDRTRKMGLPRETSLSGASKPRLRRRGGSEHCGHQLSGGCN